MVTQSSDYGHLHQQTLFRGVASGVNPYSFIEQIWIVDIADLTWEIIRLRKIKARLISDKVPDVLRPLSSLRCATTAMLPPENLYASGWPVIRRRKRELKKSDRDGLDHRQRVRSGTCERLQSIERIDEMITVIERRRNTVFHEIDGTAPLLREDCATT